MDVEEFLVKWFVGPLGNYLIMREVGWCFGPLKSSEFFRGSFSVEGLELWISKYVRRRFRGMNILMGVGFWLDPNYLDPVENVMLYDRLSFDFDCEGGKEKAVKEALNFALNVEKEHNVTPIVFESGFKGAHVVIPLSRPTDWEGYQLIWKYFYSKIPKDVRTLVDRNMLQWNRLDRVPLTWNIKEGGKAYAKIIYPEEFTYKTFEWGGLRGLDPTKINVYKVVIPNKPKVIIIKSNARNKAFKWVEKVLKIGLPDGRHRFILYDAAPYLLIIKQLSPEDALQIIKEFINNSCKNFNNCKKVYESWIKSVFKGVQRRKLLPTSLKTLQHKDPELYNIIMNILNFKLNTEF